MLDRPTTDERLGKSPQRLVPYFLLVMAVIYMGLGVFLWVANGLVVLPVGTRRILGTVFLIYGIIRFVRTYGQHFKRKPTYDDEQ
ncbi:hypothetical protein [Hymenobacter algoricola]|uniref:C4-dicarboxylate ABC transporter n=1 Tax=Hymenobacter algoricola TaxID=486267 RepID=A0ABP7NHP8_9BACT